MEFQSGAVRPVESISEGWNLIKDTYWMYVLMIFVAVVILIGVQLIFNLVNSGITVAISAVLGIATQDSGDVGRASASIVPQLISMVIGFFTSIIVVTLSGSLYCGIFMSLSRTANTNTAEFSDLFAGFQKIKECLIFAVLMSAIQFIIGLVMLLGFAAVGVSAYGLRDLLIKDGELNPAAFGGLYFGDFRFHNFFNHRKSDYFLFNGFCLSVDCRTQPVWRRSRYVKCQKRTCHPTNHRVELVARCSA